MNWFALCLRCGLWLELNVDGHCRGCRPPGAPTTEPVDGCGA